MLRNIKGSIQQNRARWREWNHFDTETWTTPAQLNPNKPTWIDGEPPEKKKNIYGVVFIA